MLKKSFASNEIGVKHVEELIQNGKLSEACYGLFDVILSKRTKSVVVSQIEPIALKFVQLCIDTNNGKLAKDGLVHYRNVVQNHDTSSIKNVFENYMEYSEYKTMETLEKTEKPIFEAIEDLDVTETPESILHSAFGDLEHKKDINLSKAQIISCLKQEWETYRNLLDVAKNNNRLESIYQLVCSKAFEFCNKYKRKLEFRRLCELLRNHMGSFAKQSERNYTVDLNDPDSLQKQLAMRFIQLSTANNLDLWSETSKSIEDIYNLFMMSNSVPDTNLIASYYYNLIKLLYTCKSYLFHAATWIQLYKMSKEIDTLNAIQISKQEIIDSIIISALVIPIDLNETEVNKYQETNPKMNKIKELVGLESIPTRNFLMKDIVKEGIYNLASQEYKELFRVLELTKFNVLMSKSIFNDILKKMKHTNHEKYRIPLLRIIWGYYILNLPCNYSTIGYNTLSSLLRITDITDDDLNIEKIEDFIVNQKLAYLKIDHYNCVIKFDLNIYKITMNSYLKKNIFENPSCDYFSNISKYMNKLLCRSKPSYVMDNVDDEQKSVDLLIILKNEHEELMKRRQYIKEKNEITEWYNEEKERRRINELNQRMQKENEYQIKKLMEQNKIREETETKRQLEKIKKNEALNYASKIKQKININEIKDISTEKVKQLQEQQQMKENEHKQNQIQDSIQKIDYLIRAYRKEEIPLLQNAKLRQLEDDKKTYEDIVNSKKEKAYSKYQKDLKIKERMQQIKNSIIDIRNQVNIEKEELFNRERDIKLDIFKQKKQEIIQNYRELVKEKQDKLKKEEESRIEQERKLQAEIEKQNELRKKRELEKAEFERKFKQQREKELEAERKIELQKQSSFKTSSSSNKFVVRKTNSVLPPSSFGTNISSDTNYLPSTSRWASNKTSSFKGESTLTSAQIPSIDKTKIMDQKTDAQPKILFKVNKTGNSQPNNAWNTKSTSSSTQISNPPASKEPEKYVPFHKRNK